MGLWNPSSAVAVVMYSMVASCSTKPGQVVCRDPITEVGRCFDNGELTLKTSSGEILVSLTKGNGRIGSPEPVIDQTVSAMKAGLHKRHLFFRYFADSSAPVSGPASLARKPGAAGVGDQHLRCSGMYRDDPRRCADYDQLAGHPGFQRVPVKCRAPSNRRHSNLT